MSKDGIIVLSLFDGMSGGRLALDRQGIAINKYYASEKDKFAIAESKANFPDHIHLGDVTKWKEWDIDWSSIDLVLGGSPCQGFSSSGKQGGTKAELGGEVFIVSTREQYLDLKEKGAKFISCSHLFWEYVLILDHIKEVNPNVKFLLENVKMAKIYLNMITETLSVEPIFINSALVSAQNRQRYYWTNIGWNNDAPTFNEWLADTNEYGGSRKEYDELYPPHIPQPEDRHIYLKDIVETEATNPTIMSNKFVARQSGRSCLVKEPKDKASSLSSMEYVKNGRQGDYLACDDNGNQIVFGCSYNRKTGLGKELNKSYPLQAGDYRGLNRNQNQTAVVYTNNLVVRATVQAHAEHTYDGKTPTLTASMGMGGGNVPLVSDPETAEKFKGKYLNKNDRLYYRKLTVIECCRLQTVPDDFFKVSSPTQAYKMLGNGWTIDVICHILSMW